MKHFYEYETIIFGNSLSLITTEKIFSPKRLDLGTKGMLDNVIVKDKAKVLDLGCGSGVVGVAIAKKIGGEFVTSVDISKEAVEVTLKNASRNGITGLTAFVSDGLKGVEESDFDLILSNPPYRTDFSVAKSFIELGYKKLNVDGQMVIVIKRLLWYKNKMTAVFGGVKVIESDGYYILISQKRAIQTKKKPKKVNKKHAKRINASKSNRK